MRLNANGADAWGVGRQVPTIGEVVWEAGEAAVRKADEGIVPDVFAKRPRDALNHLAILMVLRHIAMMLYGHLEPDGTFERLRLAIHGVDADRQSMCGQQAHLDVTGIDPEVVQSVQEQHCIHCAALHLICNPR